MKLGVIKEFVSSSLQILDFFRQKMPILNINYLRWYYTAVTDGITRRSFASDFGHDSDLRIIISFQDQSYSGGMSSKRAP